MNTTFMCTFLNQSDSSPKSCSVTYGTCGKEMYSIQGNTRKGSPFVILNSSDIRPTESDCYIITASNGTYEIVVNGSINLPVDERAAPRPFLIAIITFVLVLLLGGIVVTIGVILYWRRSQCGIHPIVFDYLIQYTVFFRLGLSYSNNNYYDS